MKSAISQLPLANLMVIDHTNDLGNGTVTLSRTDGLVVSCQPGGALQTRPTGTAGPYEIGVIDGALITYCPDGVTAYTFSFAAKVAA
jgi:hypothetical protein